MKITLALVIALFLGCSLDIAKQDEESETCWITHEPIEYRFCYEPPRNETDSLYGCMACAFDDEL